MTNELIELEEKIAAKKEILEELEKRIKSASKQFAEDRVIYNDFRSNFVAMRGISDTLGIARHQIEFNKGRWALHHPSVRENFKACIAYIREITITLENELANYEGDQK